MLWRSVRRAGTVTVAAALATTVLAPPASAVTVDSTELVSGTGHHQAAVTSADGRYVAFVTDARLLPLLDTDQVADVYIRDTVTGGLTLASGNSAQPALRPAITPDGRYVVFDTASKLAPLDLDSHPDVYRFDRQTGGIVLVSTGQRNGLATFSLDGEAVAGSISADGTRVAFESTATDLVDGDTNGQRDIFVRDLAAGTTVRANLTGLSGQALGGPSREPAISGDGRYVAFTSTATNLPGDTSGDPDVFRRDLQAGLGGTVLISLGNGAGASPSISHDGSVVAFESVDDLVLDAGETICSGPIEGRTADVFVYRDGATPPLSVVSVPAPAAGHDVDDIAGRPTVSADGQRVAFTSAPFQVLFCPNPHPLPGQPLPVPSFGTGPERIMVRDLGTATTARVDRADTGLFANDESLEPVISAAGTAVAYLSAATNLVPGATGANLKAFLTRLS